MDAFEFFDRIAKDADMKGVIDRELSQLPATFHARLAKAHNKKEEPISVPDINDYIRLGIKVRQLVTKVNYLESVINGPIKVKELSDSDIIKLKDMIGIKDDDENKSEDVASVIQWHKDTFPKADFEGQVKKWEEEYGEFLTARTNNDAAEMLSELADLFIVACGIMRFNLIQGCQRMLLWNELRYTHGWAHPTCEGAINKKMKKNRARKWEYLGNGNYHHVKGMED